MLDILEMTSWTLSGDSSCFFTVVAVPPNTHQYLPDQQLHPVLLVTEYCDQQHWTAET